tara:strand:+ start:270 stop:686 length:417 start_codon:yes stop_codon:yes gene_type:complete
MYKKNNGRTTYKSSRRPTYKKSGGYQNYKGRNNKGNVSQQYNKYLKLAKESSRSGDRVQAEYYYQFTDHYFRLMVELGISVEENTQSEEGKDLSNDQNNDSDIISSNENEETKETQDSIESIPFIADPSKDKRTRSTK